MHANAMEASHLQEANNYKTLMLKEKNHLQVET